MTAPAVSAVAFVLSGATMHAKRSPPPRPQKRRPPPPPSPSTPPSTPPTRSPFERASRPDLQAADSRGVTLEHRLREELAHPLRKGKLTLFLSLAASANVGFLFALGRAAAGKDAFDVAAVNGAVDATAVLLFGALAWREAEFGRRSVNSIAGAVQARDLPVLASPELGGRKTRLSSLLKRRDVVVAAGRSKDVTAYFARAGVAGDPGIATVLFATDSAQHEDSNDCNTDAVVPSDEDAVRDWVSWLGDAVPPRRSVVLFRVPRGDKQDERARAFIVCADDPEVLPLPKDAQRPQATRGEPEHVQSAEI